MTTDYLVIQQVQYIGDLARLDAMSDELADALAELESDVIVDPDLAVSLSTGVMDVQMVVRADYPHDAVQEAFCALRTAIHKVGGGTPGWDLHQAIMHTAPVNLSERLDLIDA